jgi:hypothetical protein
LASEHFCHETCPGRIGHTNQLSGGSSRIGQGPEHVEDRWGQQFSAHWSNEAHGGVEALGEAESHAGFRQAGLDTCGIKFDDDAEAF